MTRCGTSATTPPRTSPPRPPPPWHELCTIARHHVWLGTRKGSSSLPLSLSLFFHLVLCTPRLSMFPLSPASALRLFGTVPLSLSPFFSRHVSATVFACLGFVVLTYVTVEYQKKKKKLPQAACLSYGVIFTAPSSTT